ncbi:carbamate kinase [Stella sp.]|uniref:carbamate kinase n=1 Tax=Stella sp. TaxID=2912054 RepID=UPI0035AED611
MRIVVALGGNALLRRGETPDAASQRRNLQLAAAALAEVARAHRIVVTHGNGPQVGLLALQAEAAGGAGAWPVDVLGAESEGMLGYMIEQELGNVLDAEVAALLTRVEVDPADPAFRDPDKPVGPTYDRATAERLAAARGWRIGPDGDRWRRLMPSPTPRRIVELATIRLLVQAGIVVVCGGGGGIPIAIAPDGAAYGVEAVIDKDRSAALLAEGLGADFLLLLTDVPAVFTDWNTPRACPIRMASPDQLEAMTFAAGSMAPKVEAACRFVRRTGGTAAIGALADAARIVAGDAGTRVRTGAVGADAA